jgi:hypothetical protein
LIDVFSFSFLTYFILSGSDPSARQFEHPFGQNSNYQISWVALPNGLFLVYQRLGQGGMETEYGELKKKKTTKNLSHHCGLSFPKHTSTP